MFHTFHTETGAMAEEEFRGVCREACALPFRPKGNGNWDPVAKQLPFPSIQSDGPYIIIYLICTL